MSEAEKHAFAEAYRDNCLAALKRRMVDLESYVFNGYWPKKGSDHGVYTNPLIVTPNGPPAPIDG